MVDFFFYPLILSEAFLAYPQVSLAVCDIPAALEALQVLVQRPFLLCHDSKCLDSVDKLCLAGQNLADTGLYRDYMEHGRIWYVVFKEKKNGITVGITRSCVVTLFSKSTLDEFIEFISVEVLSLIE